MMNFPKSVHTVEQVRKIDRDAIERLAIPGYTLMNRAGVAALRVLRKRWPDAKRITIVCGSGNNGGDGYVVARLAKLAGLDVTVIALREVDALRDDAAKAHRDFIEAGGTTADWRDELIADADVIVDAIFGIGLSRSIDASLCERLQRINASSAKKFALDIPSGLDADTGLVLGEAVRADCTITFIALKIGFYLGVAAEYLGILEYDDLEIPQDVLNGDAAAARVDSVWLRSSLPKRSRLAHKGTNGHVLIIGGGIGMAGAVRLTGEACLRVGAGLVTIATCVENTASIVQERPELIVRGIGSARELHPLIERADIIAIGPGLGQDGWAQKLLTAAFSAGAFSTAKGLVIDADALNLLAKQPERNERWILTPHPGEAARLLQSSTTEIQSDRLGAAKSIARRYGGTVVLKGANTLVFKEGEKLSICDQGNPAMATPGMGDVLTGVIAGLLAQVDPWLAARAGTVAHSWAGDLAAAQLAQPSARSSGQIERGLLASDLFAFLPRCVSADE